MARLLCDAAELERFWCSTMQSNRKLSRLQKPSLVDEAGVQGVQAHPQKFWFGENPGKIP